jgi:hypothetical protein
LSGDDDDDLISFSFLTLLKFEVLGYTHTGICFNRVGSFAIFQSYSDEVLFSGERGFH